MNEIDMGIIDGFRVIHVVDENGVLVAIFQRFEE